MSQNRHEYLAVDLVRGLAALTVLLHHYQEFYFLSPGGPPTFAHRSDQPLYSLLAPIYVYSGWAVQLFWAISGFVFAAAYVEKRKTTREFIVGRFARLYPLHFITLV